MQIDWLTVSAQLINFLVLVWLLKRFLYRPVMDAMQRREQHIAARIGAAEQQEGLADQRERRYRDELRRTSSDRGPHSSQRGH